MVKGGKRQEMVMTSMLGDWKAVSLCYGQEGGCTTEDPKDRAQSDFPRNEMERAASLSSDRQTNAPLGSGVSSDGHGFWSWVLVMIH